MTAAAFAVASAVASAADPAAAPAAPAVSNSYNNANTTNQTTITDNSTNYIMMGWPQNWPVPSQWPNPFSPETMMLDPALITRATERLAGLGDPEATVMAAAVMDVVRFLHSQQAERNLFPHPARGDQALTFAEPGQWDAIPHNEARHRLVGRVLTDIDKTRRSTHSPGGAAVSRAAAPEFSAHLTNLGRQAAAGALAPATRQDCRLPRDPLRTWYFGTESLIRGSADDMIVSILLHLETCNHAQWGHVNPEEGSAAHAVVMFDRVMRDAVPENYTAFEHGGVARVWSYKGTRGEWKTVEVAEAAEAAFLTAVREFAQVVRTGTTAHESQGAYRDLRAVADFLTVVENDGARDVPTPAAAALATSAAALALFRRRSDLARRFYLGPTSQGRAGPCETDCGCSRGMARQILRDLS